MKKFAQPLLLLFLVITSFSCNNNAEPKQEDAQKLADTVAEKAVEPAPTPAPPVFKPFDIAEVSHVVKDYAKWRPFFDNDSANRKANGMNLIVVGRSTDNPNKVMIAFDLADVAKAKGFAQSPDLKKTMEKAGVMSKPFAGFYHVIRYNPDMKEKQWVLVTHKVKNFDAWLKVFDGEGTAARAEQGLYDVVLARGIDDSMMVHIVFDIKDMAKAKASINSAEKKALMKSAGVEGIPKIEFYSTAD